MARTNSVSAMSSHGDPNLGADGCENRTQTRRRLLASVGATGAVVIAGCMGDDEPERDYYEVEFLEFDTVLEIDQDPEQALLYDGLDQGWDLPYACEEGTCGQCTARYDGDANEVIRHEGNEYLDDEQVEDGWFLPCVAYAEDDFAMQTNVHPNDEE